MVVEIARWKKGVAEFVGTFALIYVGVLVLVGGFGAAVGTDLVAIAFAHGLTIAVMASATMSISGGQLNPAVTIGLLAVRKVTPAQAGVNILAQLLGGLVGGYLALASLGGADITRGVPDLGAGVSMGQAILIEAVLTFFLMFVIMGTAVDQRFGARIGGLAIGLTVALDIMAGGPLTGAAMNPARWLGAAIPAGHFANALVYFIGPILGAVAAALLYQHALLDEPRPHPEPAAQMRAEGNR
jgi:MIP family channel proteins